VPANGNTASRVLLIALVFVVLKERKPVRDLFARRERVPAKDKAASRFTGMMRPVTRLPRNDTAALSARDTCLAISPVNDRDPVRALFVCLARLPWRFKVPLRARLVLFAVDPVNDRDPVRVAWLTTGGI
jgi:hypothetical protein